MFHGNIAVIWAYTVDMGNVELINRNELAKMKEPEAVFSSAVGYIPSSDAEAACQRIGCIGSILAWPELLPILLIYLLGELAVGLFHKIRKRHYVTNRVIYDTVRIFDDCLILEVWQDRKERLTLKWINGIQIKDIKLPNVQESENPVKVFEFHHKFGQKPLLSHNITDKEYFEKLMNNKGIRIV